jgi:hypothetical protein
MVVVSPEIVELRSVEEMNALSGVRMRGKEPSQLQENQRMKKQELFRPARLRQNEASTSQLAPLHCRMPLRSLLESTMSHDTQFADQSAPMSLLVAE